MLIILNALSLNMFDEEKVIIKVQKIRPELVRRRIRKAIDRDEPIRSYIGHEDLARVISHILRCNIPVNREHYIWKFGDDIIVAQYRGPRLPEGATKLPINAEIVFYDVKAF